jgi:hypothetical protein
VRPDYVPSNFGNALKSLSLGTLKAPNRKAHRQVWAQFQPSDRLPWMSASQRLRSSGLVTANDRKVPIAGYSKHASTLPAPMPRVGLGSHYGQVHAHPAA